MSSVMDFCEAQGIDHYSITLVIYFFVQWEICVLCSSLAFVYFSTHILDIVKIEFIAHQPFEFITSGLNPGWSWMVKLCAVSPIIYTTLSMMIMELKPSQSRQNQNREIKNNSKKKLTECLTLHKGMKRSLSISFRMCGFYPSVQYSEATSVSIIIFSFGNCPSSIAYC